MNTLSYKTEYVNPKKVEKKWLLVNAEGQVLGRLASKIAYILRGKHKPQFTPNVDCGDNVVVINAAKIKLTGNKLNQKTYIRYTGYPGGQRSVLAKDLLAKHPERVLELAVKRMLPKNRLGRAIYGNLYVYAGSEHKQVAQQPENFDINSIK